MVIYRSGPVIDIPIDQNLTELLHTTAQPSGVPNDHVIFEDDIEGRSITLAELQKHAGCLAHGLSSYYNCKDESRWAVILPNSVAIIEAFHAVIWLGGIVCPINHQLLATEIAQALLLSEPGYIIAYSQIIPKVEEAVSILSRQNSQYLVPDIIVAIGDAENHRYPSLYKNFLSTSILSIPHYKDTRNRLASIHLSSGTTGLPKGVGISHHNYVANVYQLWHHDPERWNTGESVLSITPFVHLANGTIPFFLGPWTGMRHIIMASFDVASLGRLVEKTKPTTVQMLPTIIQAVVRSGAAKKYDFSSVKRINGVPVGLTDDEAEEYFGPGKWHVLQMYGLTEAACWVAMQKISEHLRPGENGTLLPGIQGRLVTEDGRDAPQGGPGELWLKGPNITHGYINNLRANKEAFPEKGWFNTGDVCTISSTGIVRVVGRTKELIKYNSFQVSPPELEAHLIRHPAVRDCAVGPTWDEERKTELRELIGTPLLLLGAPLIM